MFPATFLPAVRHPGPMSSDSMVTAAPSAWRTMETALRGLSTTVLVVAVLTGILVIVRLLSILRGIRDGEPGLREEGNHIDVPPPSLVQEDTRHPGDHPGLELRNLALLQFRAGPVRAPDPPHLRLAGDRHLGDRGQSFEGHDLPT